MARSSGAGAVGVLLGNGDGTFAAAAQFFATDRFPVSVAVSDLNGDGKLDLVTANESGSVSVLSGNGNGTFQAARNYADGKTHTSVAVADFNGDGKRDVVTADEGSGTVSLWLGNGDSTLWYAGAFITGSSPSAVVVGDFNGDGRPDVAVAAPTTAAMARSRCYSTTAIGLECRQRSRRAASTSEASPRRPARVRQAASPSPPWTAAAAC